MQAPPDSRDSSTDQHRDVPGQAAPDPSTVLVVDDVYLIRKQVAHLIDADSRLKLVGTASDGVEALELIEAHRPDLVVLDVFMPRMDGAEVLKRVKEDWPGTKVLVLTAGPDPRLHDTLMSRPDSLLYKDVVATPAQLCTEIVDLLAGREDTLGQELLGLARPLAKDRPTLTSSELRVLRRASLDEGAKEIATCLGLKPKYVQNLLNAVHKKLEVSTTVGAVGRAYEVGLLPTEDDLPTE